MSAKVMEQPLLLSVKEAAQRLSVSQRTLWREIAAKRFPRPVKIGRSSRVSVVELQGYVDRLSASRP